MFRLEFFLHVFKQFIIYSTKSLAFGATKQDVNGSHHNFTMLFFFQPNFLRMGEGGMAIKNRNT